MAEAGRGKSVSVKHCAFRPEQPLGSSPAQLGDPGIGCKRLAIERDAELRGLADRLRTGVA